MFVAAAAISAGRSLIIHLFYPSMPNIMILSEDILRPPTLNNVQ
jgi:hypothetical protein